MVAPGSQINMEALDQLRAFVTCNSYSFVEKDQKHLLGLILNKYSFPSSKGKQSGDRNGRARSSSESSYGLCSQKSILSAMDRFVDRVNKMESVVLVPSRLQDMEVDNQNEASNCTEEALSKIPPALTNANFYGFYLMLHSVKKRLFCGPDEEEPFGGVMLPVSGSKENADDADGIMDKKTREPGIDDNSARLAEALHEHLKGLYKVLNELADSADYLTYRYQHEIDASEAIFE